MVMIHFALIFSALAAGLVAVSWGASWQERKAPGPARLAFGWLCLSVMLAVAAGSLL